MNTKRKKNIIEILILIGVLGSITALISLGNLKEEHQQQYNADSQNTEVYAEKVIDGDTIHINAGERIRYAGIDAPETHHPEVGEECYDEEATAFNKQLVMGKQLYLVSDKTDSDHYGRLLRYVFTDDGVFVNYALVRNGYAQVLNIPPDDMFYDYFAEAQRQAKAEGLGIWTHCFNR